MSNVELAWLLCNVMHTLACMVGYYLSGKPDKVKECEDAYSETVHALEEQMGWGE